MSATACQRLAVQLAGRRHSSDVLLLRDREKQQFFFAASNIIIFYKFYREHCFPVFTFMSRKKRDPETRRR